MTKEIRSPNVEKLSALRSPVSSFEFRHSFGFRHSSFGFENCSLFNQKAGQRTGESGRAWVGSWKGYSGRRIVHPAVSAAGLFYSRSCLVFLVKPGVTAFEADFLPANPHPFHVAPNVQNVSIGGEEGRLLARFD